MQIVAYRNAGDIDVMFTMDKSIAYKKNYANFISGKIAHPTITKSNDFHGDRVGEISINRQGLEMQIIAYRGADDIDVQFKIDGYISKHKTYCSWKEGKIGHPNYYKLTHEGEISIASNGQTMKIIEWFSFDNVTVQFEDGTIVYNKSYKEFKHGHIKNPNCKVVRQDAKNAKALRIGETVIAKNGLKFTIIDYRNNDDLDVQAEDGYIKYNITYRNFKIGNLSHPQYKINGGKIASEKALKERQSQMIGTKYKLADGEIIEITNYINSDKVYVKCEDGIIRKTRMHDIKNLKKIAKPDLGNLKLLKKKQELIGTKYRLKNSKEEFEIIDYNNARDVLIKYSNGIKRHTTMYEIQHGICWKLPNNLEGSSKSIKINNVLYFRCSCHKCNIDMMMSVEEINTHKCV